MKFKDNAAPVSQGAEKQSGRSRTPRRQNLALNEALISIANSFGVSPNEAVYEGGMGWNIFVIRTPQSAKENPIHPTGAVSMGCGD